MPHHDGTTPFLDQYPGGWQTIFPNGGAAVTESGALIGFHGEADVAAWDWEELSGGPEPSVALTCRLRRMPFALRKVVTLSGAQLRVSEAAHNRGRVPLDVMWSHHPAFGAPFLSGGTRLETAATRFITDDERDMPDGDLQPGAESEWPYAVGRDGGRVDLRELPPESQPLDRFGYLAGFERGWARLTNPELRLAAELTWDASIFPYAWFWLEAHATAVYPWFREAYVVAVEPASSWPGQGLAAAREKTGTHLRFEPDEAKTVEVSCKLEGV